MIPVDWKKDYKGEFSCPKCGKSGMRLKGSDIQGKKSFGCLECGRKTNQSYNLKTRKTIIDINTNTFWIWKQKIEGFICPECEDSSIVFHGIKQGKKTVSMSILSSINF